MNIDNIKTILSDRNYLVLFIALFTFFLVTLIFAWNLILYTNFYVRTDLWTPFNLGAIFITAAVSALNFTLSIRYLKKNNGKPLGFFSIIPMFFTTACSGCAPIILSFWSASAAIWFAYFADLRIHLIALSLVILLVSLWKLINIKEDCQVERPLADPKN